jgi:hypothetical protein
LTGAPALDRVPGDRGPHRARSDERRGCAAAITLAQARDPFASTTEPLITTGGDAGTSGGHDHDLEIPPGF